jgi:hypothetical protein
VNKDYGLFYVTVSISKNGGTPFFRDAKVKMVGSRQFHPIRFIKAIFEHVNGSVHIIHVSAIPETDCDRGNVDFDIKIEV